MGQHIGRHMGQPNAADAGGAPRRAASEQATLVAAYREGLGLAAITVIDGPGGIHIAACRAGDDSLVAATDRPAPRWWCRRLSDAERLAAAATARVRRRAVIEGTAAKTSSASADEQSAASAEQLACEAIARAAKQLTIVLQTEAEMCAEATAVIARVDEEIERLQRAGGLKSINKSYRTYRTEAAARGEKTMRYADWMRRYREKLVRELAAALRYS